MPRRRKLKTGGKHPKKPRGRRILQPGEEEFCRDPKSLMDKQANSDKDMPRKRKLKTGGKPPKTPRMQPGADEVCRDPMALIEKQAISDTEHTMIKLPNNEEDVVIPDGNKNLNFKRLDFEAFCKSEGLKKRMNLSIFGTETSKDVAKRFLRPFCNENLLYNECTDIFCLKFHQISKKDLHSLKTTEAWEVITLILKIADTVAQNFISTVMEYLSDHKSRQKILFTSTWLLKTNNISYLKCTWDSLYKAMECCGTDRITTLNAVLKYNISLKHHLNLKVIYTLLTVWDIQSPSVIANWCVIKELVLIKDFILPPQLIAKIIGEILAFEPTNKEEIYNEVILHICRMSNEDMAFFSYRLLFDFLQKLSLEEYSQMEETLRQRLITTLSKQRFELLDKKVDKLNVHVQQEIKTDIERSLSRKNFDYVIQIVDDHIGKACLNSILIIINNHILARPASILRKILEKMKEYTGSLRIETKDCFGRVILMHILKCVEEQNWLEAETYRTLLDEFCIDKYALQPINANYCSPVLLATTYARIMHYNENYEGAVSIPIDLKLINPDPNGWLLPCKYAEDDSRNIQNTVKLMIYDFQNKGIVDYPLTLLKCILHFQQDISEPIDVIEFLEPLLYGLFRKDKEYQEIAVKLYIHVERRNDFIVLYGLTYRALIVLSYQARKRNIIDDSVIENLFLKAINEYAYPVFEEKYNEIILLYSMTEEEMLIYISKWACWFRNSLFKSNTGTENHSVTISFKECTLEDYVQNQGLGIPATLCNVDESASGYLNRLNTVLKEFGLKLAPNRKNVLLVDQKSLEMVLNRIPQRDS